MENNYPITDLKGVGAELSKKLVFLNIRTISDLILNYPKRYEDYSFVQPINKISPGLVTIKAVIKQSSGRYVSRGLHITEAVASDDSGSVRLIWFNQPYRSNSFINQEEYYISGDFQLRRQRLSIQNPSIEPVSSFPINTARIIPKYKETKGLRSHHIRKLIGQTIPLIRKTQETLPDWLVSSLKLLDRNRAIEMMHFPSDASKLIEAKRRLGFEEIFELALAALLNKKELIGEHALNIAFDEKLAKQFVSHLPFKLTDAQRKTVWQIYMDMAKDYPMNRLVEGDVGSGKTVVATMAAVMAIKQDFQVVLMAPTELLARQHAQSVEKLLSPLGLAGSLTLLVGSLTSKQKDLAYKNIKNGKVKFIVGTQAVFQEKVDMKNLGLIIIDEQHRFGVEQRKRLQAKAGHMPHVLHLTATPIPRSLALTLYGELDVSIIDTKPAGRKEIITKICSPNSKKQLYQTIDKQLELGYQMFVVCPLISDSDLLNANSAEKIFEELSTGPFKHRRVGLLHGKMKSYDKEKIMKQFVDHKLDILVATTVVEVGVDVPNATIMLIENAERFGLAQIHQLRGRVGRNDVQGYCYLMMGDSAQPSRRIRAIERSNNGFDLAELDLEIRGPGAIYGTTQHGQLDLRVARLTDIKLITSARNAARIFIEQGDSLLQYKELNRRVTALRSVTNLN